jgi:hypothetical protein
VRGRTRRPTGSGRRPTSWCTSARRSPRLRAGRKGVGRTSAGRAGERESERSTRARTHRHAVGPSVTDGHRVKVDDRPVLGGGASIAVDDGGGKDGKVAAAVRFARLSTAGSEWSDADPPPPSRPAAVMAAAHHVEGPALKLLEGGEPEADKVLHVDSRALGRAPERLAVPSIREADLGRRVDEEDVGVLGLSSGGG